MQATEKLYLANSFLAENDAVVLECRPCTRKGLDKKFAWEILLDKTVFFPEGGGQPSDFGSLDDVEIGYVYERDDLVWHCAAAPIEAGSKVHCRIDFMHRFNLMQQHTGEHLVCSAAFSLYGANNVGFHLGEDSLAVDFDQTFTEEQLVEIEELVNSYLYRSIPVKIGTISPQEYLTAEMRKKADGLQGEIRTINVEGIDYVTCCGTHCENTAQVGMVKILKAERYKGGTRVEFACGVRALSIFRQYNNIVMELSRRFSLKPALALQGVDRQAEEITQLKNELQKAERLLARMVAQTLAEKAVQLPIGRLVVGDISKYAGIGKLISDELSHSSGTMAALFAVGDDGITYFTAAASDSPKKARELCGAIGGILGGKGGGSELIAQGRAPKTDAYSDIENKLKNLLCEV